MDFHCTVGFVTTGKDSVAASRDSNAAGEGGAVEVTRACDLQDIANLRSIRATKFPLLPQGVW